MTKTQILKEVQTQLRGLSIEKLLLAKDFLIFLKEKELNQATRELLNIPGFYEKFLLARQQIEGGELVNFEDVRRHD
jgi:hypothetical protein